MAECLKHWTLDREIAGSNPGTGSNLLPDPPLLWLRVNVDSVSSPSDETKT